MDITAILGAGALVGATALGATLIADHGVPARAVPAYIAAARGAPCPLDYRFVTAIGQVESGHGTHGGANIDNEDGQLTKDVESYAGAVGVTQFMPATWDAYGVDGDGDGNADPNDVDDAAASTANYLCANGGNADIDNALWNYNHDWDYVTMVKERAMALPPDDGSTAAFDTAGAALAKAPEAPAEDKGRICGVGEWLDAGNNCMSEARDKADDVWDSFGSILHTDDTKRLYEAWEDLNGKPPTKPAPVAPAAPPPGSQTDGLVCPVTTGLEVGDGWGVSRGGGTRTHQGVDLYGTPGSPIVAPFNGVISSVENDEGSGGNGGLSVGVLAQGGKWDGHRVWMAHNEANVVSPGQAVKQGETIATVGNTGNARSTPHHAHTQWYRPGDGLAPAEEITAACGGAPK